MMTYMKEGRLSISSSDSKQQKVIKQIQKLYQEMKAATLNNKTSSSGKHGADIPKFGS